jgi:hypothetical protein
MTKVAAILFATLACAPPIDEDDSTCGSEDQGSPEEVGQVALAVGQQLLTFGLFGTNERKGDTYALYHCAAVRWRNATCLPLDISFEPAHKMRWATAEEMGDYTGRVWGDYDSATIKLLDGMATETQECQVMVHEIGHILRRDYGHPGSTRYGMSYPSTSTSRSRITQEDVDFVCEERDCGCENPEPAVP